MDSASWQQSNFLSNLTCNSMSVEVWDVIKQKSNRSIFIFLCFFFVFFELRFISWNNSAMLPSVNESLLTVSDLISLSDSDRVSKHRGSGARSQARGGRASGCHHNNDKKQKIAADGSMFSLSS